MSFGTAEIQSQMYKNPLWMDLLIPIQNIPNIFSNFGWSFDWINDF